MPESHNPDKENSLSQKDLDNVKRRYEERIKQFGVSFDSLNSGDNLKQLLRCEAHLQAINPEAHILDIGCGLGFFYTFLEERNFKNRYTGYDIIKEYIEYCKTNYPNASFECRNIFEEGIEGTYDTIVMSQVLNNRYANSDNMKVMCEAIELAYKHTTHSVSIDMMSKYVDFENPELFYYQPEEIFSFAKKITRKVKLLHDYRPFEFCIQLFH